MSTIKTYTYNKNGKEFRVTRKYTKSGIKRGTKCTLNPEIFVSIWQQTIAPYNRKLCDVLEEFCISKGAYYRYKNRWANPLDALQEDERLDEDQEGD